MMSVMRQGCGVVRRPREKLRASSPLGWLGQASQVCWISLMRPVTTSKPLQAGERGRGRHIHHPAVWGCQSHTMQSSQGQFEPSYGVHLHFMELD